MFHFIAMDWPKAYEHLNCVYMSVNSDKEGIRAHVSSMPFPKTKMQA